MSPRSPLAITARAAAAFITVFVAVLAGIGWLYLLRGAQPLDVGPAVRDSLPLLQLAGTDQQPLLRIVLAWIASGAVAGWALAGIRRPWRVVIAGAAALCLLLLASQASYALTRNLYFADVLWSRGPGFGPWLEGLLFGAACALPRTVVPKRIHGGATRRARGALTVLRNLGMRVR